MVCGEVDILSNGELSRNRKRRAHILRCVHCSDLFIIHCSEQNPLFTLKLTVGRYRRYGMPEVGANHPCQSRCDQLLADELTKNSSLKTVLL